MVFIFPVDNVGKWRKIDGIQLITGDKPVDSVDIVMIIHQIPSIGHMSYPEDSADFLFPLIS